MNRNTATMFAVVGVFVFSAMIVASMWVSAHNNEVRLRNAITAKQEDNKNQFDNMFKKISQVAQVTQKDRDSLAKIFVDHAKARTTSSNAAIMKWIQESVPKVDSTTFKNLQNIITASRNSWTMSQREILDLKREHDNVLTTFPSSMFVGSRPNIKVTIVTSTRTEESFETGKDDNTDLFK